MTDLGKLVLDIAGAASGAAPVTWSPFREGIEIHRLYDREDGSSAALLRYAPGAALPAHVHGGFEHIVVLSGAQVDSQGAYPAGSLVINPPHSSHAVRSPDGCVVLVIWERPVVFLGGDA